MGGKESKLLCCRSSSNSTLSSSKNKKNNKKSSFQSDHYQNIEDYLVERSSSNDSIQKMSFQPLFFDFNKCALSSYGTSDKIPESRSNSKEQKNSKFENLVDIVTDFFELKPYANVQASMIQSQMPIDQRDQYERAYIESKEPSELTVFLKREQSASTKYYSQVNEYIFSNVRSLDEYLDRIEVKLNDQMDHQIESSKILYQQKLKEGFQLQIIYVIFKKLTYQKSRDLIYVKIHKMLDSNTCIQAYQSVQIKCEQSTLIDPDSEQTLAFAAAATGYNNNSPSAGAATTPGTPGITATTNSSKQPYMKQKTNGQKGRKTSCSSNTVTEDKYERAMLYMGGKKITFVPEKNEIHLQELQSLDMKIETQHMFQKEVIIHQTKKIFEKIKSTLAQQQAQ